MGAWGHNSFENDDALDWVADLEDQAGVALIIEALDEVSSEAEAPECATAIAAAEVVAALHGNPAQDLPDAVSAWVKMKPRPGGRVLAKARRAVDKVLASESELHGVWVEKAEDFPKWTAALKDLRTRLA